MHVHLAVASVEQDNAGALGATSSVQGHVDVMTGAETLAMILTVTSKMLHPVT